MENNNQAKAKLFVGGLATEATEDTLRRHFSKYGNVEEALIIIDRVTGNKRGFGFVTFAHPSMAEKALQDHHVILGQKVDVKRANPKNGQDSQEQNNNGSSIDEYSNINEGDHHQTQFHAKKIFVGGLPPDITEEEFRNYFEQFGEITDAAVIHDKQNQKPRGFGFVTFESEDAVKDVLKNKFHEVSHKKVEVKRARPKVKNIVANNQNRYYNWYNMNDEFGEDYSTCGYYGMYPSLSPWYWNNSFYYYG